MQSVSLLHLQGSVIQSAFVLFLSSPNVHSANTYCPVFSHPFPRPSQMFTLSKYLLSVIQSFLALFLSSLNVHSQQTLSVIKSFLTLFLSSSNVHWYITVSNPVFSHPFPVFPKCSLSANTQSVIQSFLALFLSSPNVQS